MSFTRFSRPSRALAIAGATALALSACGGGGSSASDYTVPADADLVVTAVPTIKWDASSYTANAGEITVFLANDDSVKHVLVIRQGDKVVGDLELVASKRGDTAEGTISLDAGEYSVYCIVPGHGNMNSTITVS